MKLQSEGDKGRRQDRRPRSRSSTEEAPGQHRCRTDPRGGRRSPQRSAVRAVRSRPASPPSGIPRSLAASRSSVPAWATAPRRSPCRRAHRVFSYGQTAAMANQARRRARPPATVIENHFHGRPGCRSPRVAPVVDKAMPPEKRARGGKAVRLDVGSLRCPSPTRRWRSASTARRGSGRLRRTTSTRRRGSASSGAGERDRRPDVGGRARWCWCNDDGRFSPGLSSSPHHPTWCRAWRSRCRPTPAARGGCGSTARSRTGRCSLNPLGTEAITTVTCNDSSGVPAVRAVAGVRAGGARRHDPADALLAPARHRRHRVVEVLRLRPGRQRRERGRGNDEAAARRGRPAPLFTCSSGKRKLTATIPQMPDGYHWRVSLAIANRPRRSTSWRSPTPSGRTICRGTARSSSTTAPVSM